MNHNLVIAASLFATVATIASAPKDNSVANGSKPTIADAQKLVQTISRDKAKLKAYCDLVPLQKQLEDAEQKQDVKAVEALGAKADGLMMQLGPDYLKMMEQLDDVDPDSDAGKRFAAVFDPLKKQCK